MTAARDDLAKSEAILVAAIEVNVPELVSARKVIGDFQSMIRSKSAHKLDHGLGTAKCSLVSSSAGGVEKDIDAVRTRKARPAASTADRCDVGPNFSKCASEPNANAQSWPVTADNKEYHESVFCPCLSASLPDQTKRNHQTGNT